MNDAVQAWLPDIPRLYTALAEWLGCMVYVVILKKRVRGPRLWLLAALMLAVQCAVQLAAGALPLAFWVPGMIAAVLAMLGCIAACCSLPLYDSCCCTLRAFTVAEFAASLEWQLSCYYLGPDEPAAGLRALALLAAVYAAVYGAVLAAERRQMPRDGALGMTRRGLWGSAATALIVFAVSNLSFLGTATPFSGRQRQEIFYIRTLVDFCGMVLLYNQQVQHRAMQMKYELDAIQNILHLQYEQYRQSKESIDLVNRKYHDLKHQIAVIRAEASPEKREDYLREMESGLKMVEAQNKTGNAVLDTVLTGKSMYCAGHGINLNCVADGTLLEFMHVMDICTIFGNALDNAIESVETLADPDKRLIRLAVCAQNDLLLLRFENYCEASLHFEDGLPRTTKGDSGYHGYGIKSIRYAAEKYGGSVTVRNSDNWFRLCVLIPLPGGTQAAGAAVQA